MLVYSKNAFVEYHVPLALALLSTLTTPHPISAQFFLIHPRDFDVNVDTIQQWTHTIGQFFRALLEIGVEFEG